MNILGECALNPVQNELAQLREDRRYLALLLNDCANRLERCMCHGGTEKEYAAMSVAEYRAAVARVLP